MPDDNSAPLLVDCKQAAALLGVSRSKIWEMAKQGYLKTIKLPPKSTRFNYEQLKQIAAQGV